MLWIAACEHAVLAVVRVLGVAAAACLLRFARCRNKQQNDQKPRSDIQNTLKHCGTASNTVKQERVRPRHGGSERLRVVLQSLERGADFGYRFTDAMARAPSRWPVAPGALFEKPLFERPFLTFDCVGSVRHSTRSESTALDTHFRVPPAPPLPTPL